ncbi:LigA protein [Streptomyces himastatinicus ATCC 53653]|uniref:LigA protein n=1 Tax=Streptomyces himastatinicus ATCC 53653 TaxID=457427 RepID=D9W5Y9_9ACTN|nr:hypothetical protein [Streptomyces himastatinicus]EFL20345.1 LigA protein [Streptomyces himastatinicus ATCC 53653]
MVFVHHSLLTATFLAPHPALLPRLIERLRHETLRCLQIAEYIPTALLEELIASGDRQLLQGLAAGDNRRAWFDSRRAPAVPGVTRRKDALLRLAALGDPALAKPLFDSEVWELRIAVLTAAAARPDDPDWRLPGGLVDTLLCARGLDEFAFAVCAPFSDVAEWARKHLGERFPPNDQVFVCRRVAKLGGASALRGILEEGSPASVTAGVLRQAVKAQDPIAVFPYDARAFELVDGTYKERLLFPSDLAPASGSGPGPTALPPDERREPAEASDWCVPASRIEELLALDDPETNAKIFLYAQPTDEQRSAILEGRPFAPDAPAGKRLPLSEDLVASIRSNSGGWLWSSYASGHPELARAVLGKYKLLTPARRLALVTALWERSGRDAVQALLDETRFPGRRPKRHPLTYETHRAVQQALNAPDGLGRLRQMLAHAQSPEGQRDFLLSLRSEAQCFNGGKAIVKEMDDQPPWAELIDAHRREPLHEHLLAVLAERQDVPKELRKDCAAALVRLRHPDHTRCRSSEPRTTLGLLRHHPEPHEDWLRLAYRYEELTPTDTLREARPARAVVQHLLGLFPTRLDQSLIRPYRCAHAQARRMAYAQLGTDPDAWAMAARLLPEFEGTFPELLTTAAAVIS